MELESKTVPNQLEQKCKILERDLRQCEEKFSRFFHAAANAIAITTLAGVYWERDRDQGRRFE
jgi:hypothetical protein